MAKPERSLVRWLGLGFTVLVVMVGSVFASGQLVAKITRNTERIEKLEDRMTKFEDNQGTANEWLKKIWESVAAKGKAD